MKWNGVVMMFRSSHNAKLLAAFRRSSQILGDKYEPAPSNFIASNPVKFSYLVNRLEVIEKNRETMILT